MPMNGALLGASIASALESGGYLADGVVAADIQPLWVDIANEIINHIVTNGVVTANGLPTLPVQVVPATGTGATTAPDVVTGTIA